MKVEIEIQCGLIPEGYEAMAFSGSYSSTAKIVNGCGDVVDAWGSVGPRLILRKKPPKVRPFNESESPLLVGKPVRNKTSGVVVLINRFDPGEPRPISTTGGASMSLSYLLDYHTFVDGSPCGVTE